MMSTYEDRFENAATRRRAEWAGVEPKSTEPEPEVEPEVKAKPKAPRKPKKDAA